MFPQINPAQMNDSRNYEEEVLHSKFAFKIYRKILLEDANYTKEIAEQLESKPQSVSNYIKGLREHNLIIKSEKMGRKQLYSAQPEALFQLWANMRGRDGEEHIEDYAEKIRDRYDGQTENKFRTRIKPFIVNFALGVIVNNGSPEYPSQPQTFEDVFGSYFEQLVHAHVRSNWSEVPKWLGGFLFVYWFDDDGDFESEIVNLAIGSKIKDIDELRLNGGQ